MNKYKVSLDVYDDWQAQTIHLLSSTPSGLTSAELRKQIGGINMDLNVSFHNMLAQMVRNGVLEKRTGQVGNSNRPLNIYTLVDQVGRAFALMEEANRSDIVKVLKNCVEAEKTSGLSYYEQQKLLRSL